MEKKITSELFLKSIKKYEALLEQEYLSNVETAADKEYTADFFHASLFSENEMVPYTTLLFDQLLFAFEHNAKLFGFNSSFEKTVVLMDEIRHYANNSLHNAQLYYNGNRQVKLPELYELYIQSGFYTLYELIKIEESVVDYTNENLFGALAIHFAGENLAKKHPLETSELEETPNIEGMSEGGGDFTLNERTLALYILLSSLGFKQGRNEYRTSLASLYHLIMDKNFNDSTKVKNSNIYKALSNAPFVVKDTSKLNTYLQNIRPFFEKAEMQAALDLIDEFIKKDV